MRLIHTTGESWRVVVLTTSGDGAYPFLDALLDSLGHRIVGVLTTPGPPSIRTKDYLGVVSAAKPDVDVMVSVHRHRWAPLLASLEPDLIICAAFPSRIPDDVIALPRLGAINGHSSLLPAYRGPNPQGWVLRNGEPETGFTIHRITTEFDAGPVLSQVRVALSDDDDITSLEGKLKPLLLGAFTTALTRIGRGEVGEPQDPAGVSRAPFFDVEWQRVDWSRTARTIHNQVRSLFEMPGQPAGAVATVRGREIRIFKTKLVDDDWVAAHAQQSSIAAGSDNPLPGALVGEEGAELTVQCVDTRLRIIEWANV